jgi:hypothetical protein
MKIDWSKWSFIVDASIWSEVVTAINKSEYIAINVSGFNKHIEYSDNAVKCIKEAVKKCIRQYYVEQQLKKWSGQTIAVEDNLDYIENEAERRGLI